MKGTINKVILIGYLGDEVKMHYFEGGFSIGRFPLATNESYTNKDGDEIVTTEWHKLVVKNKLAEICEKYLTKGDRIYCEGRIKSRQWTGDDGQPRYTTEIYVKDLTFLSNKKQEKAHLSTKQNDSSIKASDLETPEENDNLPF